MLVLLAAAAIGATLWYRAGLGSTRPIEGRWRLDAEQMVAEVLRVNPGASSQAVAGL